jgi:5,10-methylenetetrahydrofolate reductase
MRHGTGCLIESTTSSLCILLSSRSPTAQGGSTRERTHELVVRLKRETELDPVPHLTTVLQTQDEIERILERYADAGISNIMALRGDPPQDVNNYDPTG